MSSYIKFTENDMRLAKQADLIQYMLADHVSAGGNDFF